MARQNIDEKWKTDPRRTALAERLGSGRLADGMRVEINWLLLSHRGLEIPLKVFKFVKDWEIWIECELGEVSNDHVRIAGADEYQAFFEKQSLNAKKPRKAASKRQPKLAKISQTQPNLAKPSLTEPNQPSFSSSLSFSNSTSISSSSSERTVSSKPTKAGAFIAGYKVRFFNRWRTKINVEGKDAGIAKRLAERFSFDEIEDQLDAFFLMPDAELIQKRHPLFLFEAKLSQVMVFSQTGEFTTRREAQHADDFATNAMLLQKVREGKL